MTNFEKFKNMTIEELAKFIDDNGMYDDTPWMEWWSDNYCDKCESVVLNFEDTKKILDLTPFYPDREQECAYCEVYNKCKYFPELEEEPSMKDIVKLWLEAEDGKVLG